MLFVEFKIVRGRGVFRGIGIIMYLVLDMLFLRYLWDSWGDVEDEVSYRFWGLWEMELGVDMVSCLECGVSIAYRIVDIKLEWRLGFMFIYWRGWVCWIVVDCFIEKREERNWILIVVLCWCKLLILALLSDGYLEIVCIVFVIFFLVYSYF